MDEYDSMKQDIQDIIYKAIGHKGTEFILDRFDRLYELTVVRIVLRDLGFTFSRRKTYYNSVVEMYKDKVNRIIVKLDLETFNIYITAR